jgi:hypothetical protein
MELLFMMIVTMTMVGLIEHWMRLTVKRRLHNNKKDISDIDLWPSAQRKSVESESDKSDDCNGFFQVRQLESETETKSYTADSESEKSDNESYQNILEDTSDHTADEDVAMVITYLPLKD